jgi:hypothetical protein
MITIAKDVVQLLDELQVSEALRVSVATIRR